MPLTLTVESKALLAVVGLVVGLGVGWLLWSDHLFLSGPYRVLPAEYVYLDVARVDAYLGQLENGLAKSEKQDLSSVRTTSAAVTANQILNIGGSSSTTQAIERTVTPDEGDRFYQLLNQLKNNFSSNFHSIDLAKGPSEVTNQADAVPEGDFVEFEHARLVVPRFALVVPALSFGVQVTFKGERPIARAALAQLAASYPNQVKRYLAAFGTDPRIPLQIAAPGHGLEQFLIPVRVSGLLNSLTLVSGDLKILGKVVLQVAPRAAGSQSGYDFRDSFYYDTFAAAAAKHAVAKTPPDVSRVLQLPRNVTTLKMRVDDASRISGPGMVVVPIAIYR
jgi:hypothetical protein